MLWLLSDVFTTLAWYGHLKFGEIQWLSKLEILRFILISWGIAFFEYCMQVPANHMGFEQYVGPFNLFQ